MDSINSRRFFFFLLCFIILPGCTFLNQVLGTDIFFLTPFPNIPPFWILMTSKTSFPPKYISNIFSIYFVLNCSYMYHAIVQGHLKVSSKEHKFLWNYLQQIIFHLHSSITKYNVKTSVTSAACRLGLSPSSTIVLHLLAPFSLTELLGFKNIASYIQD